MFLLGLFIGFLIVLEREYGGAWTKAFVFSVFLLLGGALSVASGSLRFAFGFTLVLAALISQGSQIKHRVLGTPLLVWDLRYLAGLDQFETILHYQGWSLFLFEAVLLLLALGFGLRFLLRKGRPLQARRAGVLIFGVGVLLFGGTFAPAQRHSNAYTWIQGRQPIASFIWSSLSSSRIQLIPSPLEGPETPASGSGATRPRTLPHLVGILEESTLNLQVLEGYEPTKEDRGFYSPVGGLGGRLNVHTFGGATWLSEFSFLTGLPTTALGPVGAYAPFVMEGRIYDGLPQFLKRMGYRTIAIYPIRGDFVNARAFYKSLGFDEFLDPKDLGIAETSSWALTDRRLFEVALSKLTTQLRSDPEKPVMLWILTLANHGPWKQACAEGEVLHPVLKELPTPCRCPWGDYLGRVRESQYALSWFRNSLEQEPAVRRRGVSLVHFGDHQPTISEPLLGRSGLGGIRASRRHETYYAVLPPKGTAGKLDLPASDQTVDIAYLAGLWLESSGIPLSGTWLRRHQLGKACQWQYPIYERTACFGQIRAFHQQLISGGALGL